MQRARRAANTVLALLVALCLSSGPATTLPIVTLARAASVVWPPSTLVLSEVQTGGASASDEFVEIANQGGGPVDLVGLEVVYATSSGSTVTRKGTWASSTILDAGKRILVVNGAGSYVAMGDATYTGGFAATGGALALRVVGGSVVDAVGWGDATNAFVEGTAAPAPPAGSSLERRPGGAAGNGTDSNDNAADWIVSAAPGPQNLGAAPIPDPGTTPGPSATPIPTATATPTPTPIGTPSLEPTPSPTPSPSDTPAPTLEPTPSPGPTASPTPEPTPSPTPIPTPTPISIAAARALPDGATATVSGVLTTDLGALESGRTAFLQDESGGIAIYLDAAVVKPLAAGTAVIAVGIVDERYAQRTLRVTESELTQLGLSGLPTPITSTTAAASEPLEGRVVTVNAPIVGAPESLADGTAVSVDDGSGALRVIVTPTALGGRELAVGSSVTATGPLGQRDSTGTGASGYRLYVTRAEDLSIAAPPTPTPAPTPSPTPDPTPTPIPSASPAPSPSPSPSAPPSPSPAGSTIAAARAVPVGSIVTVRGIVTAEAGRLGTPALFAIGDATGGIVVRLPSGVAGPARGRIIDVRGALAEPYGQLEIRPAAASDLVVGATAVLPALVDLPPSGPDETSEGRLSRITGVVVVRPVKATSGDIGLTIETENGTHVRIMADASSGIATSSFDLHARYRITGIAGQRASKKGAPDGYRIWARDPNDIVLLAAAPSPSAGASAKPKSAGSAPAAVSIAAALRTADRDVAIEAIVTAPASLLDTSGRRIVVQDSTAAVEILLPKDTKAPAIGTRIRAVGRIGTAYGAPRLRAASLDRRGSGTVPAPLRVNGPLSSTHTWRLVSIGGRVEGVHKLGGRWRAEIVVGAARIVVIGQPGSGIPSTALAEGGTADIVGIVRPAYPSATDRRAAVLPRSSGDVKSSLATSSAASSSGQAGAGALGGSLTGAASSMSAALAAAPDADLIDLASLVGQTVRVGGLVVELRPTGFTLDDGTAVGLVVLTGAAAEVLPLVEPDDAINVVGRVERVDDGELAVVVDDPAAIALGSSLDGLAVPQPSVAATDDATAAASDVRVAGFGDAADWLPGAGAGLAGLLGISLASVAVTVLRRRQVRRLMASRIAVRLATIGAPRGPGRDPTTT
jgi:hypothetical protein